MPEHTQFLRNEFAMVQVTLATDGNVQVLRIRNAETDEMIELDPLELEALTRMRHREFGPLIVAEDPGTLPA